MILGKTTHNLDQAREAIRDGADYISVGPVFATPTKPGRPAVGLAYVREAAGQLHIPFVAIGRDRPLEHRRHTRVRGEDNRRGEGVRRCPGITSADQEAVRLRVVVSGKTMEMKEGISVRDFMDVHGFTSKQAIVVFLNDKVVHDDVWPQTVLGEGDRLESLVSLVGGG